MDIKTKVAGVTKSNPDGTNRQDIIYEQVTGYSDLYLKREPENPYDENAVAVYLAEGDIKLGYIKSALAEEISGKLARGVDIYVTDFEVTGGEGGKKVGLNIQIGTEGTTKKERLESADKAGNTVGLVIGGFILGLLALGGYFVYQIVSIF